MPQLPYGATRSANWQRSKKSEWPCVRLPELLQICFRHTEGKYRIVIAGSDWLVLLEVYIFAYS